MSTFAKVLLLSAAAAGAAAALTRLLIPRTAQPHRPSGSHSYVDADQLSDEERRLLLDEMQKQW